MEQEYIEKELTQREISNLNVLIYMFRLRMREDRNIFSVDDVFNFINLSLIDFNTTPPFSNINFQYNDWELNYSYKESIVDGAVIISKIYRYMIEKGDEFIIDFDKSIFSQSQIIKSIDCKLINMLQYHLKNISNKKEMEHMQ